jgi:hypothetical protein
VTIDLYKAGSFYRSIGTAGADVGTFSWPIPSSLTAGDDYKVKIYQGSLEDYSDGYFTIWVAPSITVTQPTSSSNWVTGTAYNINWTSTGDIGFVAILLLKGGTLHTELNSSTWNDGVYSWTPPYSLSTGSDYQIEIAHTTNPIVNDTSPNFTITKYIDFQKNDIVGNWPDSGVWYRNSDTFAWVNFSSPALPIAAGDLDGDGLADLVGVWAGSGVWVRYSFQGGWAKLSSPPLPVDIACGDVNGDGRDDLVGSWPSGTFYRDTLGGSWTYVTSTADVLACGDLDGDGTDDIIGSWSNGLWVKYSSTGTWGRLDSHPPDDIACGDLNGDGRDDLLATWSAYGTFYRDTLGKSWVYMSAPADLVAAGDLDGDGIYDLIGTWSPAAYQGLWVKHSGIMGWKKIVLDLPTDIDAGVFRGGAWDADAGAHMNIQPNMSGYTKGPESLTVYEDLSDEGPGGWNFVYQEEGNLVPHMSEVKELRRPPGPGEPGFSYIQQKNLVPMEETGSKKKNRK